MNQLVSQINEQWKSTNLQQQLLETVDPTWIPFFKKTNLFDALLEIQLKLDQELEIYGSGIAILPRPNNVFRTFSIPMNQVKVVILGQDVYPNIRKHKGTDEFEEEAMGLAFSVPDQIKIPPSLRNIFKEIDRTHQVKHTNGDLSPWLNQGVIMLNSALTVRQFAAGSHMKLWHQWTDTLIEKLSFEKPHLVFMLWGNFAKDKSHLIKKYKKILKAGHPSPLNRKHPFVGCGHFKEVPEISW